MSDLAIVRFKEVRLHQQIEIFRKQVFGWTDVDAIERINGLQIIAAVDGGSTNLVLIPWARIAYTVRSVDPAGDQKLDQVSGMLAAAVPPAAIEVDVPAAAVTDIQRQIAARKKGKR